MSTEGGEPCARRARGFARFATFLLVYLLFVILFGAWVRITGSGAGCGEHWPTCHGELIPRTPTEATVIEYTHRLTSGLLGVLTLGLPLGAWLIFPRGHRARLYSVLTALLVAVEAAIGAGLVLRGLVASNSSWQRALAVALHLGNTLLLTAAAVSTVAAARARSATGVLPARAGAVLPGRLPVRLLLLGLFVVSATGAVTALGDTLFPLRPGAAFSVPAASDHFLVQLRALHPLLAVACLGFAGYLGALWAALPPARAIAIALLALSVLQGFAGVINIWLAAPGWLQLMHLLLAQLLWMSAVLLARLNQGARSGFGPSALP